MARLQAGDKMPNFTFNTAYRQGQTVQQALQAAPKTVFWVLRYIGCTLCRYDLHLLAQRYGEFTAKGAQVLVVLQSAPQVVRKDLEGAPLPFEVVCDTDLALYNALEIAPAPSLQALLGDDPGQVQQFQQKVAAAKECGFAHGEYEGVEEQLPALFVVGQDGTVQYAHYAATIMDMPAIDQVLALL